MESTTEAALNPEELAQMARARASFYAFVNVHFTTLPDLGFVSHIRSSEYASALQALVDDDTLPDDVTQGAALMQGYIQSNLGLEPPAFSDNLGVDRTRLYRGVSPNYGPPPPYEAVWTKSGIGVTQLLQLVAQMYRESGMAVSADSKERLDYVGVELSFAQQLALREAEAWEAGDSERAKALLQQQSGFLANHVGQWAPFFIETALQRADTDFYRGHLRLVRGLLASEQERIQSLLEEVGPAA